MSLSAVFKYMAKQAVDCRNMVRVKVWHPQHCLVTQKLESTYFNVLYAYFIIGPNVRSHYDVDHDVRLDANSLNNFIHLDR